MGCGRSSLCLKGSVWLVAILFVGVLTILSAGAEEPSTRAEYFTAIGFADMDLDGDLDFVTGSTSFGLLRFFENHISNGTLDGHPMTDKLNSAMVDIVVDDLDMDGDPDVAVTGSTKVSVYQNNRTTEMKLVSLDTLTSDAKAMDGADMDGDGDTDLVVADTNGNIRVIENTRDLGTFSGTDTASLTSQTPRAVACGDLDIDGNPDVAIGAASGKIFISTGNGDLSLASPSEKAVSPSLSPIVDIEAVDVDNDGDLDLLVGDGGGNVFWVRNGRGTWTALSGVTVGAGIVAMAASDVDLDGDVDVVASDDDNALYLILNGGSGSFIKSDYGSDSEKIAVVGAGDLDSDGDPDIVLGMTSTKLQVVYRNVPHPQVGSLVPFGWGTGPTPVGLQVCDINQDGGPDSLIGGTGGTENLVLLRKNSTGEGFSLTSTGAGSADIRAFAAGDIDGDGFDDVIAAQSDNTVSFHVNDGSGILTQQAAPIADSTVNDIVLADLFADGTMDAVIAYDGGLDVYSYNGTGFDKHDIITGLLNVVAIDIADLDRDGDLDIVGRDDMGDLFRWENITGTYTQTIIDSAGSGTGPIVLLDADLNGEMDIASAGGSANIYLVYQSAGSFGSSTSKGTANNTITTFTALDFDLDGDKDIVTGDSDGAVNVFYNPRAGATWSKQFMEALPAAVADMDHTDITHDGYPDIMAVDVNGGIFGMGGYSGPRPNIEFVRLVNGEVDGHTCYAQRPLPYVFSVNVTESTGIDSLTNLTLVLDPLGLNLRYVWDRAADSFTVQRDPNGYTTLVSDGADSSNDATDTWTINFEIIFDWSFPSNTTMSFEAFAVNSVGLTGYLHNFSFAMVVSDLVTYGTMELKDGADLILDDAWVKSSTTLNWSGMKVGYLGNQYLSPNGQFSVTITDDDSGSWSKQIDYGQPVYLECVTDGATDLNETLTLTFTNLASGLVIPAQAVDIHVDGDEPDMILNLTIHADSFTDTQTGMDNDKEIFVTWDPASDIGNGTTGYYYSFVDNSGTTNASFTSDTQLKLDLTESGEITFYIWATDGVGNLGPASNESFIIDTVPVVFNPVIPTEAFSTAAAQCEATITDLNGTGVVGSSVEYTYSTTGFSGLGNTWTSAGLTDNSTSLNAQVTVTFAPGTNNYIKWRARDRAGNLGESDPVNYMINLTDPPDPLVAVNLSVTAIGKDSVELTWTQNSHQLFTVYEVHSSNESAFTPDMSTLLITISQANTTTHTVKGLTTDTKYFFTVITQISTGEKKASNRVNATPTDGGGPVTDVDTDGDGMSDEWEEGYGLDPHNGNDSDQDPDGDGLTNLEEYIADTHPGKMDTDGDGLGDKTELDGTTDPLDPDSDDDGVIDGDDPAPMDPDIPDASTDGDGDGDGGMGAYAPCLLFLGLGLILVVLVAVLIFVFTRKKSEPEPEPQRPTTTVTHAKTKHGEVAGPVAHSEVEHVGTDHEHRTTEYRQHIHHKHAHSHHHKQHHDHYVQEDEVPEDMDEVGGMCYEEEVEECEIYEQESMLEEEDIDQLDDPGVYALGEGEEDIEEPEIDDDEDWDLDEPVEEDEDEDDDWDLMDMDD